MSNNHSELFDQLYRDNQPKVYHLALAMTANTHDAEDVTQEAFFRAFRFYDSFRQDSSFFTWIYRITLNVANDHLKYRNKLPLQTYTEDMGLALEDVIDTNPANNPETELLARQVRIKCLHAMTECLQENERKVFCLAITLGLPHKHVADILECSVGSVKTTLHRAKKKWFGYMEDMCSYINKSNPCNCKQFVRFAVKNGMTPDNALRDPRPSITLQAGKEVIGLRTMRDFYEDLYHDKADQSFAERIREGIKKNEWQIFS